MVSWLQNGIWSNRLKTRLLILLFPISLALVIFLILYRFVDGNKEQALYETWQILVIGTPILIIVLVVLFIYEKQIMFSFSWAKEISRKDYPELYNIVENLCISRWLITPKIWLIEEEWMNAFALWWNSKDSRICFTTWLVKNLNHREIEAVAWHELTHIINKDCLLMLVTVLYIWGIWTLGRYLVNWWYSSNDEERRWNILLHIWIALIALWYLFYPLIRLAISRKREFLADAWSVLLTQDNQAMISALRKISKDPEVKLNSDSIASLFIENPLSKISTLFQTHPSIEDRIKALQSYWY